MKRCVRCGWGKRAHESDGRVYMIGEPKVCHRFEEPAPWYLRALTRLIGGRSR